MAEVMCGKCKHMKWAKQDGLELRWGACTAPVPIWVIDEMGEIRDKVWEHMGEECQMFAARGATTAGKEARFWGLAMLKELQRGVAAAAIKKNE